MSGRVCTLHIKHKQTDLN